MIIDDIRLSDPGASNDRDGYAAEGLSPDLHELEQIHVETEPEPTAPSASAAAEHADTGIDSPLGIYFRDIARIPLLTAEQEVDLAQKLERARSPSNVFGTVPRRPRPSSPRSSVTSRSATAPAPP